MSILGTRVLRTEDPRLLTAGGTYVDDLRVPELAGAARVTFVRSPLAHARITGSDAAPLPLGGPWLEPLPAVVDLGEAMAGRTLLFPDAGSNAVSHLGVRHIDMPTTPARVWAAISQARESQ
jgi:CO/xanthine dehydrogenase Mo-binding subunit